MQVLALLRCASLASAVVVDPDRLDVDELADAVGAELASVAGVLDAAKRQARVGDDHAVHEHLPCLDLVDETCAFRDVVRPHAGAEPERRVVCQANRLGGITYPEKGGDRPEQLFGVCGRTGRDVGQYRWRVVVPRAIERVSTGQHTRTGRD